MNLKRSDQPDSRETVSHNARGGIDSFWKARLGFGFWYLQLILLGFQIVFTVLAWLAQPGEYQTARALLVITAESSLYTFTIGNCVALGMALAAPLLAVYQELPQFWGVFLGVYIPISAVSSSIAAVVRRIASGQVEHLFQLSLSEILAGTFFSLVIGMPMAISERTKGRLQARNRELERQVTVGQIRQEAYDAELKAAHEIQAHLMPRELPQMKPFQIACAWEPALSVGGDYFDVLTLEPDQLQIFMADVSGKGITAALLMANLQAAVRAFAPGIPGPGALCTKLNAVLCGSIVPSKFVTLFYGVIKGDLTLRFGNAGHSPPIVLRGEDAKILTAGGTVLGLFQGITYEEHQFELRRGDCLILTTDGVTEAANEQDEEFGNERVIAAARAARSLGAQGIRTRILEDVARFCNGNFHDDASLMVVTVS